MKKLMDCLFFQLWESKENFKMKKIYIIISLFFISACGDNNLNKVEKLGSFRILAIKSNQPEFTQTNGLVVTAQAFVSDINSGGRAITADVEGCIDPGIANGAEASCEGSQSRVVSTSTVDTSGTPLVPQWSTPTGNLSIPDTIFSGKSDREKFNGVPFLIIFNFLVDGSTYKSYKRVFITNRTVLNTNPILTTINLNGNGLARPANGDMLTAVYSGAESYDYQLVNGLTETRTEKLVMAWYVSDGIIDMPKTNANESIMYKSDPPIGQLLVIGILRDERGGVAVFQSVL